MISSARCSSSGPIRRRNRRPSIRGNAMRRHRLLLLGLLFGVGVAPIAANAQTSKALNIYVVDVEGGNATLFAAPSGQSVLIDTGNGGPAAARDAERILAAAKDAGVVQID